jgi:hypothetical protein
MGFMSWRRRQDQAEGPVVKNCKYCTGGYINGEMCQACGGTGKTLMLYRHHRRGDRHPG